MYGGREQKDGAYQHDEAGNRREELTHCGGRSTKSIRYNDQVDQAQRESSSGISGQHVPDNNNQQMRDIMSPILRCSDKLSIRRLD